MDRQTTFLIALVMLIGAAATVGVGGIVLLRRDRRWALASEGGVDSAPKGQDGSVHPEGSKER